VLGYTNDYAGYFAPTTTSPRRGRPARRHRSTRTGTAGRTGSRTRTSATAA
jgi:hypothetical protein